MRGLASLLVACCLALPAAADPVDAVSRWREADGLGPVARDRGIEEEAARHAARIAGWGRLDHGAFRARMRSAGLSRGAVENLASGMERFDTALDRWAQSPGHLVNLRYPMAARAGVGRAVDGEGRTFWVLILAR